MRVFDLHCDTLTVCMEQRDSLRSARGHLSLERGAALDQWAQVFAVFVPEKLRGQAAAAYCDRAIAFYQQQREEVEAACTPLLAVENASALAGELYRIDALAKQGVRVITLTWNGENELGFGAHCNPNKGLTLFGKAALWRMFELGVHPDVSHLNEAGFWDAVLLAQRAGKPLLATHSACAALKPQPRNLNDAQLRALFSLGSLVGLCLYPEFLGGDGTARECAAHLNHLIALGGQHHIALGSDFDGCTLHPSLAGVEHLPRLNEDLAALELSPGIREAFFWNNAARFFALPAPRRSG